MNIDSAIVKVGVAWVCDFVLVLNRGFVDAFFNGIWFGVTVYILSLEDTGNCAISQYKPNLLLPLSDEKVLKYSGLKRVDMIYVSA